MARKIIHRESVPFMKKGADGKTPLIRERLAALAAQYPDALIRSPRPNYGPYFKVTVSVEDTENVRHQTRGTCQACASSVAIDEQGFTSRHGYRRPGIGYIYGDCAGAQQQPAEKTTVLTKQIIASLTEQAERLEARATELVAKNGGSSSFFRNAEDGDEYSKARYTAVGNRDYAKHLTQHALPQLGKDFITVEV